MRDDICQSCGEVATRPGMVNARKNGRMPKRLYQCERCTSSDVIPYPLLVAQVADGKIALSDPYVVHVAQFFGRTYEDVAFEVKNHADKHRAAVVEKELV